MKRFVAVSACVLVLGSIAAFAHAADDECMIIASGVKSGFKGNFDGRVGGLIAPDSSIADVSTFDATQDYLEGYEYRGDRVSACFNRALLLLEEFCETHRRGAFQLHGAHIGDAMLVSSSYFTESKLNKWGMISCANGTKTAHFRAWREVGASDFEARDIPIQCFKKSKYSLDPYMY